MPAFVDAAEGAAAGDAAEELPLVGFDLEGASVWVCRGADIEMVRAIIRALRRARDRSDGAVRVMVATRPVDFRKGVEGLAALVRETMKADPFSGAVYVFRAKRADRVKLIYWTVRACVFMPNGLRAARSAGRRSRTA